MIDNTSVSTYETAVERIKLAIGSSHPLASLAAEALALGYSQGYGDFPLGTDNPELQELLKDLVCPWDGKLHKNQLHDSLALISSDQWTEARKKFPDTYSYELLAKKANLL